MPIRSHTYLSTSECIERALFALVFGGKSLLQRVTRTWLYLHELEERDLPEALRTAFAVLRLELESRRDPYEPVLNSSALQTWTDKQLLNHARELGRVLVAAINQLATTGTLSASDNERA